MDTEVVYKYAVDTTDGILELQNFRIHRIYSPALEISYSEP